MKKKVLVPFMVIALLIATATTAFAATNPCTLNPDNKGEVKTAELVASRFHGAAYNQSYSKDNMMYKLQAYKGEWRKVEERPITLGEYYATPQPLNADPAMRVRTKLWSRLGEGGVTGVGSVCDF